MSELRPLFKNSEVIVKVDKTAIKLTEEELEDEVVAKVLYVGEEAIGKYSEGDTVLFSKKLASKVKYLGGDIWKVPHYKYIICQLVECDSL